MWIHYDTSKLQTKMVQLVRFGKGNTVALKGVARDLEDVLSECRGSGVGKHGEVGANSEGA